MADTKPTTDPYADETWKPVVGWESRYEVSNYGRVWSISRKIAHRGGTRTVGGRMLKCSPLRSGHMTVALCESSDRQVKYLVHRLVLEAFVGPCPEGMEGLHYDDIPANNHLSNLRWGTRSDNMHDRTRNGIDMNGTKNATHCSRGHEFDESNTIHYRGHRSCRTCVNAAARRRVVKKRKSTPPKPPKTHCKWGHLLESPNLREKNLPKKHCKACHRASAYVSYHKDMKPEYQRISDSYYRDIMR